VYAAVIVNRNAGALRRDPTLLARMETLCAGRATLLPTDDLAHLSRVATRVAAGRARHVGIVGGDGTASATLTALLNAYGGAALPDVALLRGGTMNTVAHSLGIPCKRPLQLLASALDAWTRPDAARWRARPALWVGSRLAFLFGTGVMVGYLDAYYRAGHGAPTPFTAARVLARAASSALVFGPGIRELLTESTLSLTFDGGQLEQRSYLSVAAGTVPHLGLGFRAFHRAFDSDERFQLLAIHGKPAEVARELPRVWAGRGMTTRVARDTMTAWAKLESPAGRFAYFVDGDLLEAQGPLELRLGPPWRILASSSD
jgi:diacylglycerol kinase family enzyme